MDNIWNRSHPFHKWINLTLLYIPEQPVEEFNHTATFHVPTELPRAGCSLPAHSQPCAPKAVLSVGVWFWGRPAYTCGMWTSRHCFWLGRRKLHTMGHGGHRQASPSYGFYDVRIFFFHLDKHIRISLYDLCFLYLVKVTSLPSNHTDILYFKLVKFVFNIQLV